MNQRDFGVPDVRCYDRALFAAVKCLALYCRSQIFCIEAASRRTREKLKGRFAVQGFFFFFLPSSEFASVAALYIHVQHFHSEVEFLLWS